VNNWHRANRALSFQKRGQDSDEYTTNNFGITYAPYRLSRCASFTWMICYFQISMSYTDVRPLNHRRLHLGVCYDWSNEPLKLKAFWVVSNRRVRIQC
jgi:hypothetical protein